MKMPRVWLPVLGLAALSGMRSMTPAAGVGRYLAHLHPGEQLPAPAGLLNDPLVADGLTLLAAGELLADKIPFLPSRTDLLPLLGRGGLGGLVAASLAGTLGLNRGVAALLGAAAAIVNTFLTYHLRRAVVEKAQVSDVWVALAEDTVVVALSAGVLDAIGRNEQ